AVRLALGVLGVGRAVLAVAVALVAGGGPGARGGARGVGGFADVVDDSQAAVAVGHFARAVLEQLCVLLHAVVAALASADRAGIFHRRHGMAPARGLLGQFL